MVAHHLLFGDDRKFVVFHMQRDFECLDEGAIFFLLGLSPWWARSSTIAKGAVLIRNVSLEDGTVEENEPLSCVGFCAQKRRATRQTAGLCRKDSHSIWPQQAQDELNGVPHVSEINIVVRRVLGSPESPSSVLWVLEDKFDSLVENRCAALKSALSKQINASAAAQSKVRLMPLQQSCHT